MHNHTYDLLYRNNWISSSHLVPEDLNRPLVPGSNHHLCNTVCSHRRWSHSLGCSDSSHTWSSRGHSLDSHNLEKFAYVLVDWNKTQIICQIIQNMLNKTWCILRCNAYFLTIFYLYCSVFFIKLQPFSLHMIASTNYSTWFILFSPLGIHYFLRVWRPQISTKYWPDWTTVMLR